MTDRQPHTPETMSWAAEVAGFLASTGLNQARFARAIDVSNATVNRWMQGYREPLPLAKAGIREAVRRLMEEQER